LLTASGNGDQDALRRLIPLVYQELHRMASHYMRKERLGHTLQTSSLVNEAYLKLIDQKDVRWQNRVAFFRCGSSINRRMLVDHVRSRIRAKRGGHLKKVSLDETAIVSMDKAAISSCLMMH
jgi:RNA polymerase sigma factor (TIGR02999 family)